MAALRRLPPGYGFRPTDEELIHGHLRPKVEAAEGRRVDDDNHGLIAEVDILRYEPWDLPSRSSLEAGGEWYFFCVLKKKYLNGSRVNRATRRGYWKSTGDDQPVCSSSSSRPIGFRKRLVFYRGRAPRGERTAWKIHEYRLEPAALSRRGAATGYVLCRLSKENRPPAASEPSAAAAALMDVLDLEEADLLPLHPDAAPLVPVAVPVVVPAIDVALATFWENISRQDVSAGGSAEGYVAEHGASHVAEHEESHVAEEVEWRTVYEELPPLSEGFSIDESHSALPAAPPAPATFAAPAPGGVAPAALAGAALRVAERAAPRAPGAAAVPSRLAVPVPPAPVPPAPAAGATTITAALAGLARARAAHGAAAPLGRTHARATVRARSRPVRAAGAVMHGRRMQALNAPQLAGGGGGARLASTSAPSQNLGARPAPHEQLRLAEADGTVGDEDCLMGAHRLSRDQHEGMVAATPVAATPVAEFDGWGLDPHMELSVVADVTRAAPSPPVAAGPRLAPPPLPAASAAAPAAAEVVLPPPVAAPAAAAEGGAGGSAAGAVVVEEGGAVVEGGGVCAGARPMADLIAHSAWKTRAQRHQWQQYLPARRSVNLGAAFSAAVRTPAGAAAAAA
ncbi:unnamed protein product [Closterium sp. Naga37s-1]|nr:unnamed protein product [Closterium sp. Naga37s-1]